MLRLVRDHDIDAVYVASDRLAIAHQRATVKLGNHWTRLSNVLFCVNNSVSITPSGCLETESITLLLEAMEVEVGRH